MSRILEITEGWTKELEPFTLRADGAPVELPTSLPGSVELILRTKEGELKEHTGEVTVDPDQTEDGNRGQVSYTPVAGELVRDEAPYSIRWKVTDSEGKVVYFPNGKADELMVFRP